MKFRHCLSTVEVIHRVANNWTNNALAVFRCFFFYCNNSLLCIQIWIFEKTTYPSPTEINQTKQNQMKNDNSCKVPIIYTIYTYIFCLESATTEWRTKTVYVVCYFSEFEIKVLFSNNRWDFDMHESPPVWFLEDCYLNKCVSFRKKSGISYVLFMIMKICELSHSNIWIASGSYSHTYFIHALSKN